MMDYLLLEVVKVAFFLVFISQFSHFYKTEDEKNPLSYFCVTLNPILSSVIKIKYQTSILQKGFTLSNLRGLEFSHFFSPSLL